jgi:hypothetical protein
MSAAFVLGIVIVIFAIVIGMVILMWAFKEVFGSSEWLAGVEICTDIWQNTYNETQYYVCMNPLDREAYGTETNPPPSSTVNEYIKEIKFQTCHVNFDIYNLSSYYRCIEL